MTDSDKIQTLPLPFLERMKEMLGDDYDAFHESYENPRTYGLRVNTAKLSCQDFRNFPLSQSGRSRGSAPDTSMMRKAAPPDVLTTRQDFIIFRSQVP